MKKILTLLLVLIPILISAQESKKKITYVNFPISIGLGFDRLYSLDHVETNDFDIYDEYNEYNRFDRWSTINIPIFFKINLGRFHITPTYSIPLTKNKGYNYYKKSIPEIDFPWTLERHAASEGYTEIGERVLTEYRNVWGEVNQSRKGIYFTFDVIKTKTDYPFTVELGLGYFKNTRTLKITEKKYWFTPVYHVEYLYWKGNELWGHYTYDWDDSHQIELDNQKTYTIKTTNSETPILLSVGFKNVRLKLEYVFSNDNYGTIGIEFIL